jgi:hypothetical protein
VWKARYEVLPITWAGEAATATLSGIVRFCNSRSAPLTTGSRGVQNPCPKSTSHNQPCRGVVRRSVHGSSAWLCPRLHQRPALTAPGRRPGACWLLSGGHRDGQRRPHRPARPRAGPGPAAARRHPGRLETGPPRPVPAASGRHRDRPGRPRRRVPQLAGGDRYHHPRRQAGLPRLRRPGRIRTRPHPRADQRRASSGQGPRPPRRPTPSDDRPQVAQEMYASGQYTVSAIARILGVSRAPSTATSPSLCPDEGPGVEGRDG